MKEKEKWIKEKENGNKAIVGFIFSVAGLLLPFTGIQLLFLIFALVIRLMAIRG